MKWPLRIAMLSVVTMGATGAESGPERGAPANTLAVETASGWVTWWRGDWSPHRRDETAPLAKEVNWQPGSAGLEWGELRIRAAGEAWRTRLVLVRLDPRRVNLSLVTAFTRNQGWTVGDAGEDVVVALDAGQFRRSLPFGWVVSQGHEVLKPEYAPLAGAVVVDRSGAVRVVAPDKVAAEQVQKQAWEAFQSYPMLLQDGEVLLAVREAGHGVNLRHRDARLALGTLADGRVIIGLTRFDALGKSFERVPFGLTTPEMAAIMRALGCRQALLLDGGISSQLSVREAAGSLRSWPGSRSVPMGLIGRSRE